MNRIALVLVLVPILGCGIGGAPFEPGNAQPELVAPEGEAGDDAADPPAPDAPPEAGADAHDAGEPHDDGAQDAPEEGQDAAQDAPGADAVVPPVDAATEADACTLYAHSDGIGQAWADCTPLGTYDQTEAAAACAAYVAAGGAGPCSNIPIPCGMQGATSVCAPAYCWVYEGSAAGQVLIGSGPAACTTPAGTWR